MTKPKQKPRKATAVTEEREILREIILQFKKESWIFRFCQAHKNTLISLFLLVILGIVGFIVAYRASAQTITFTVRQLPGRVFQESQYSNLIYTDKGVFENVDNLSFLKFRSTDIYNQIEEKHTYTCKVAGWRIGFFSTYKNIIDCNGFKY